MRTLLVVTLLAAAGADARADDAKPELTGLAVGVAVGEPSSVTGRYTITPGKLHVDLALGTGTLAGMGLELHGGIAFTPLVLYRQGATSVPLYVGLGGRYYRHGYDMASVDELPDVHAGIRASIGVALDLAARHLEVYGEAAPGWDLYRSDSCSLRSGVDSVCPHAAESSGFVQVMVGARWYFGA